MAKISRAIQKIFGSAAAGDEIAQIGSLRAGSINYTTDLVVMQALSQYDDGLNGIVHVSKFIPALEDINAMYFMLTTQVAYEFQEGIAEWDATTTYYKNSVVKKVSGTGGIQDLYYSLTDTNLNNAVTDTGNWLPLGTTVGTGASEYGLIGKATGAATTNYGVYGEASGGTTNYAGYFNGLTKVIGSTSNLFRVEAAITSSLVGAVQITRTGACSTSYGIVLTQTGGTADNRGIFAETTGVGVDNHGIYGQATGAGTSNYGVYGVASGGTTGNYAGYFAATGAAGQTLVAGIYATVSGDCPNSAAVSGISTATGTDTWAGSFQNSGAGTTNIGVHGEATGAATNNYGGDFSATGAATANFGVDGSASGAITNFAGNFNATGAHTTNYGVYGSANGAATNWAGYFDDGNVKIVNNLMVDGYSKLGGAEALKYYTYTDTISAAEEAAGVITITVTSHDLTKAYYVASIYDVSLSKPYSQGASAASNKNIYVIGQTATTVNVYFGSGFLENDVVRLMVIEAE